MKLTVDGIEYDVLVTSLSRRGKIKESKLSGDVKSGNRFRDLIGTYYDYEMEIGTDRLSPEDYDALYEILTAPVESHTVSLPYGRSESMEFEAYIQTVDDNLKNDTTSGRVWGNLAVSFYAKKPQRRPT